MANSLAARRWWTIMPIVFITYSLAYLDRANYGFAAAAGIPGPRDQQGPVVADRRAVLPRLLLLPDSRRDLCGTPQREEARVRQPDPVGRVRALTGVVSNIPSLMAIRFVLGVVEAAVMPAMLIYISNWFTNERSRANTFLILQPGHRAVDVDRVGLSRARIPAGATCSSPKACRPSSAVCWWFLVQDKPADSPWLNAREMR